MVGAGMVLAVLYIELVEIKLRSITTLPTLPSPIVALHHW